MPDSPNSPTWSVMIPAYRPGPFLEAAIRSVVAQDRGIDRMEIVVVDDASGDPTLAERIAKVGGDRVRLEVNKSNLGLVANWNQCIRLARGHLVHILHQDDLVLPTFYETLERHAAAHPAAGMFFTRSAYTDVNLLVGYVTDLESRLPGVLPHFVERIAGRNRLTCASVAVRRDVYETIGGFDPDLKYVCDWEMWVRIAAQYPVFYEPSVLAHYRVHDASETYAVTFRPGLLGDIGRAFRKTARYLPPDVVARCAGDRRAWMAECALVAAGRSWERRAYAWTMMYAFRSFALRPTIDSVKVGSRPAREVAGRVRRRAAALVAHRSGRR